MKTAVIGSRNFTDELLLRKTLESFKITTLVSGGAIGADSMAQQYADSKSIPTQIFKPDYTKYHPKLAPLMRNQQIVSASEQVIAFWDGQSRGTINALKHAEKQGKPVHIVRFDPLQKVALNPVDSVTSIRHETLKKEANDK